MTLKLLMMAGGLLAVVMGGAALHFLRSRNRITPDQLSGDWLAQARGREEQQPW